MSSTVKVMVGRDGLNLLGEGRARLLELLDERRSLRRAATEMGMSYRYAWGVIKHLEEAFGQKLVMSRKGGTSGGGTVLTAAGLELLEEYRKVHATALSAADGKLMRVIVVLAARDKEGRFASMMGSLPRGTASISDPPEKVLAGLIERTGARCRLNGGPLVRSDPKEGLFLVYMASTAGPLNDGASLDELGPDDRKLLGGSVRKA